MSDIAPSADSTADADAEFMAAVDELFRAQGVEPMEAGEAPPVDPASPTDADTGTPAPESAPDAAPSSASGQPDESNSVASSPVDEVPDPTANLIDLGNGLVADRDDLANLYRWSTDLTPEQAALVERVLQDPTAASGSGHPAPAPGYGQALPGAGGAPYPSPYQQPPAYQPYQPPVQYPIQYPAAGQPGIPVTPQQAAGIPDPRAALGPLAELAPELIDYLAARDAQLTQQSQALEFYQRQQADLAARAARDEQARREAQIAAGHEAFKQSHPDLTDVDMHYLAQKAASLQVMGGLVAQHNGDVTAAYQDALTTAMYSDPTYRDRVIQSQVDQFATDLQTLNERKADAASLSGSGGSIPRLPQSAPAEMTPDQRRAAMAKFIADQATS